MFDYKPTVGVRIEKRKGKKYGVKMTPYCDFYIKVGENGDEIVKALGSYGVHSKNRGKFVKVQGIENCTILSGILNNEWFNEVMILFATGKHNELDGILDLIELIEQKHDINNKQELMSLIMNK